MYRGTTPTLTVHTPYLQGEIMDGFITIKQGAVQMDIRVDDERVIVEDKIINVCLNQHDTLKFSDTRNAKMQLRLKLSNGAVVASNIMEIDVRGVLKGGEI